MMIHYLTDPVVASHRQLDTNWSVAGLLAEVAKSNDPPFHALIDGGALVTGMTNLEVARCVRVVDNTAENFIGVGPLWAQYCGGAGRCAFLKMEIKMALKRCV